MEEERGYFTYNEEGKVVWQSDKNGNFTIYKSGDKTVTMKKLPEFETIPMIENETKNFLLGKDAGRNIIIGHHNICLGDNSGVDITDESYQFRIGERYSKVLTPLQFDMLYAALKWIIAGDDYMIGGQVPVTGDDSTKIGSENKWYKK